MTGSIQYIHTYNAKRESKKTYAKNGKEDNY